MGLFYPSSEGYLMVRIQNVCEKTIIICLIPILVGHYLFYGPFEGLAPNNEVKDVLIHMR